MGSVVIKPRLFYRKIVPEELKKLENQRLKYTEKYDSDILMLNNPNFVHKDIIFEIYISSIQNKINNTKNSFKVQNNLEFIGNDYYEYYGKYKVQTFNINKLDKNKFIFCQKIIYTENKFVNNKLYLIYFTDKIIFFIFLLFETSYSLYFKEYYFNLNLFLEEELIENIICFPFEKYYKFSNLTLNEIQEEYYLQTIKNNLSDTFKVINLLDISGFYLINRTNCHENIEDDKLLTNNYNCLIKNPLIELNNLIEKQISKLQYTK